MAARAKTTKPKRTKKPAARVDEPEGGIEVVPLWMFSPEQCLAPYGNQYVSGPLIQDRRLTLPGVPIRVRSWQYVEKELLVRRGKKGIQLACLPEDMTLDRLAKIYQTEFDNPVRWAHVLAAPLTG